MELKLQLPKNDEIDLFNKEDEKAFNVHARYFPDGIEPGVAENDRGEYELDIIIDDPKFTVLSIKDGDRFAGGAPVEDMGDHIGETAIFFLTVEYRSKGLGKTALDMVDTAMHMKRRTPSLTICSAKRGQDVYTHIRRTTTHPVNTFAKSSV